MYGVKANIAADHRFMRAGARVTVTNPNPGWAGERVEVSGLSRGGRRVETWIDVRALRNLRPCWIPEGVAAHCFGAREIAQAWADEMTARYGLGASAAMTAESD